MTEIDKLTKARLSAFRGLIASGVSAWRQVEGSYTFGGDGQELRVTFDPDVLALSFRYIDLAGSVRLENIALLEEPSNLGIGKVLYFLCPYSGRKCRTLYTDGYVFASRYALKNAVYSYQNKSKKDRAFERMFAFVRPDSPERPGGKITYRGKLTPYGRRVARYYARVEAGNRALQGYISRSLESL